tara:strand:+ start:3877 stop:4203 length:327 start_codon:yes stop_codon:yes gene_type:complete
MAYVTFFVNTGSEVIRICSEESNADFIVSALNAFRTEVEAAEIKPINKSGDSGTGEYGSPEWHESAISEMTDKDDVVNYMVGVGINDYDKRGGVDVVKQKAIEAVYNV